MALSLIHVTPWHDCDVLCLHVIVTYLTDTLSDRLLSDVTHLCSEQRPLPIPT